MVMNGPILELRINEMFKSSDSFDNDYRMYVKQQSCPFIQDLDQLNPEKTSIEEDCLIANPSHQQELRNLLKKVRLIQ